MVHVREDNSEKAWRQSRERLGRFLEQRHADGGKRNRELARQHTARVKELASHDEPTVPLEMTEEDISDLAAAVDLCRQHRIEERQRQSVRVNEIGGAM